MCVCVGVSESYRAYTQSTDHRHSKDRTIEGVRRSYFMLREMTNSQIVEYVKNFDGYMLTNNERDVSQSDFKGRIMPWTTLRAASPRDMVGYFAFEVSGGASVHVDLMKKQINPFDKLSLVRKAMPNTLIQAGVRSHNLFGYRPYGENVIRKVISQIAKYVDVFRVYDFF